MFKSLFWGLCFSPFALAAQNNFYIKPAIAAGVGNVRGIPESGHSFTGAFNPSFSIGRQFAAFRVETGLAYLQNGFRYANISLRGDSSEGREGRLSMKTIVSPVKAGAVLQASDCVQLVPMLGLQASYYLNSRTDYTDENGEEIDYGGIRNVANKAGLSATAALPVEVQLGNKSAFSLGPAVQYAITPLIKNMDARLYTVLFDIGWLYHF